MKKPIAMALTLILALGLCSCGEKLYSEEEFLKALNDMYDTEFEIVDKKVENSQVEYIVSPSDAPGKNFLVTSKLGFSSDFAPSHNSIVPCHQMYLYYDDEAMAEQLEKKGTFSNDCYSYDCKYYATAHMNRDTIKIDIQSWKDDIIVYSFEPCRSSDFWGICWEEDNYNLWIQSADIGVICYSMVDEVWERDEDAVRPESVISKYDK